ncbi:hypothetical protein PV783_14110 [Chitinophaga sp. CC14]|uniref:hypothetical protein n=1 Tax=Chitinophaga sp. CC14 TaxID=3029199 RepID=UPI003B7E5932
MQTRHLLGVHFVKNVDKFGSLVLKQYSELKKREVPELIPMLAEKRCQHFYITQTVLNDCEKIRLRSSFDLNWLTEKLDENVKQYSFGGEFIRYVRKADKLMALYCKSVAMPKDQLRLPNEVGINYAIYDFNLAINVVESTEGNYKLPIAQQGLTLFYQLLTFILLAPVETYIVPPGRKHGTRNSSDRLLNEESFPFTIVNSNWNKICINMEGFPVSGENGKGFARSQACGPGWKDRKLIWVLPFRKEGYVLGAKREKISS